MTCRRVNSETSIVGMAEESANGSSYASGILRTSASASAGVQIFSWCSVPRCAATARACGDSSYPLSRKPIEKVFTGPEAAFRISATTREESIPPERNAPSGTSLIIRYRMEESSRAESSSSYSPSLRARPSAFPQWSNRSQ